MTLHKLYTIGVGRYAKAPEHDIPGVPDAIERIYRAVTDETTQHVDLSDLNTAADIQVELGTWAETAHHGEAHIIYWIGHGQHVEGTYRVAFPDTPFPLKDVLTWSQTNFAGLSRDYLKLRKMYQAQSWALLILDTCGSFEGTAEIWAEIIRGGHGAPKNFVIVSTADGNDGGASFAGHFARRFEEIATTGWTGNDDGRPLRAILERLSDHAGLSIHGTFSPDIKLASLAAGPTMQATMDVYARLTRALADAPDEVRDHFYAAAQGGALDELSWDLCGRIDDRAAAADWLNGTNTGILAITGEAGVGKSALLGMVAIDADPHLAGILAAASPASHDHPHPQPHPEPRELTFTSGPGQFDAIVHLQGKTIDDIAAAFLPVYSNDTDNTGNHPGQGAGGSVHDVLVAASTYGGPAPTVIVDALDEAARPVEAAALLRTLSAFTCIIVGTRASSALAIAGGLSDRQSLIDLLGENVTVHTVSNDPDAVRQFVTTRLQRMVTLGELTLTDDDITTFAGVVAGHDQPFLFAQLAVHELRHSQPDFSHELSVWLYLAGGINTMFNNAIERLRATAPKAEALLHALAYSHGAGYPRQSPVWRAAASHFTDEKLTDQDIADTLELCAPYIMHATQFGQGTYRLAHRALVDTYLTRDQVNADSNTTGGLS